MIDLVEKSEASLATWLSTMWADYRTDLLAAGMSADEADKNIERNRAHLMNGDRPSPGQHILDVINDGAVVGTLWLGHLPSQGPDEWFVYDIVIDETLRGTGLGRATMIAAEKFVTSHSGKRLALNVFGPNTVARRLYESLDYQVMSVSMFKDLAQSRPARSPLVVFYGVVPIGDHVLVVGRPLHHSLTHELVGAQLKREGLSWMQHVRWSVFAGNESHQKDRTKVVHRVEVGKRHGHVRTRIFHRHRPRAGRG